MTRRILSATIVLVCAWVLTIQSDGATITWSNSHPEGPALARDCRGNPLWGTTEFGPEPDLSLGALVQLWKAVGHIDDPRMIASRDASRDASWRIDDILLDESHMGFGTFTHPNGSWSHTGDYPVNEGDTVYVRAYNLAKPDLATGPCPKVGIHNDLDMIAFETVGNVMNPQTLFFDDLRTWGPCCVSEPSALLFLSPALALLAMRRRSEHVR